MTFGAYPSWMDVFRSLDGCVSVIGWMCFGPWMGMFGPIIDGGGEVQSHFTDGEQLRLFAFDVFEVELYFSHLLVEIACRDD